MTKIKKRAVDYICEIASNKKGSDITTYQFKEHAFTDFAVVISVKNVIHGRAMVEDIMSAYKKSPDQFKEEDKPKMSGDYTSGWIILDMGTIVIHILDESLRKFYELDALFETRAIVYHN